MAMSDAGMALAGGGSSHLAAAQRVRLVGHHHHPRVIWRSGPMTINRVVLWASLYALHLVLRSYPVSTYYPHTFWVLMWLFKPIDRRADDEITPKRPP